ncbi:SANT/Myb-like DNA-binding domain-containing protein [Sphingomonas japonica]|uniref:Myb-like domain-containing protein n=1 Tax=Sphingomonas japonica TaxID=511662 RepID=A0ABX0U2M3_9SPHN|nr:SANT/Myb-like DNA-binding domain-containing protein [Sphingomonas japonica]NIJ24815.1 hypothetical protein [Sphingomonas japonica]
MTAPAWTPAEDKLLLAAAEHTDLSWAILSLDHFPRRTPMELQQRHSELSRESVG